MIGGSRFNNIVDNKLFNFGDILIFYAIIPEGKRASVLWSGMFYNRLRPSDLFLMLDSNRIRRIPTTPTKPLFDSVGFHRNRNKF